MAEFALCSESGQKNLRKAQSEFIERPKTGILLDEGVCVFSALLMRLSLLQRAAPE